MKYSIGLYLSGALLGCLLFAAIGIITLHGGSSPNPNGVPVSYTSHEQIQSAPPLSPVVMQLLDGMVGAQDFESFEEALEQLPSTINRNQVRDFCVSKAIAGARDRIQYNHSNEDLEWIDGYIETLAEYCKTIPDAYAKAHAFIGLSEFQEDGKAYMAIAFDALKSDKTVWERPSFDSAGSVEPMAFSTSSEAPSEAQFGEAEPSSMLAWLALFGAGAGCSLTFLVSKFLERSISSAGAFLVPEFLKSMGMTKAAEVATPKGD